MRISLILQCWGAEQANSVEGGGVMEQLTAVSQRWSKRETHSKALGKLDTNIFSFMYS